jgi:serine protease Do
MRQGACHDVREDECPTPSPTVRARCIIDVVSRVPPPAEVLKVFVRSMAVGVAIAALGAGCTSTPAREPSREDVVLDRLLPSAVQIVLENPEGRRFRTGSGVVIASRPRGQGSECFVLTSGHTVADTKGQRAIYLLFGRERGAGTKEVGSLVAYRATADLDLALLRAESDECVPAHVAAPPRLGEAIWVVTFPWGRNLVLARGIVSQLNGDSATDREATPRLMVDASVGYGASGGGVYSARDGGLIGLVEGYRTARVTSQGNEPSWYIDVPMPGQTLVTPLSDIRRFLTETGHSDLILATKDTTSLASR